MNHLNDEQLNKLKKEIEESDYSEQGDKFLQATNTKMTVHLIGHDYYFDEDKDTRDIYRVTLDRDGEIMQFRFGQSLNDSGYSLDTPIAYKDKRSGGIYAHKGFRQNVTLIRKRKAPNAYDILTCLTKYDPCSFHDFCGDYGYDTDSIKATKIYEAVCKEYRDLRRLFSVNELEVMAEIQ